MQSVVRSTLVLGVFAFAGLTACGDKITQQGTPVDSVVHSVVVSPASVPNMKIGDKVTLAASVDAGAGVTDRTVAWSSSNTAVVTVDQGGVVTAVAGGTASVIAKATANPAVQGAAAITVGANVAATITIGNVNQTTCTFVGCFSVPANIAAIMGQIDVTLNVDPGTQTLAGVDLIMNCTGTGNSATDTVVASQNLGADKAPVGGEEASAPVQLSFNTASFNASTGAVSFKNGNCTLKGRARTAAGTQSGSNTEVLVLVNPDVIIGTMASTKQASNPLTGLLWRGGDVTISETPVFFTPGRSSVSSTISFEGVNAPVGAAAQSVTYLDTNNPASTNPLNIDNKTDANSDASVQVIAVDNSGNTFQNPNGFGIVTAASYLANPGAGGVPQFCGPACVAGGTTPFRLDTQKPTSGGFTLASNTDQNTGPNAFLNASFRFAGDSAAGYRGADRLGFDAAGLPPNMNCVPVGGVKTTSNCDFSGVDSVTVLFQTGTTNTGTFTTVANPANLPETATGTANLLRQVTTDRLGNADTSWVCPAGACPQWSAVGAPASAKFGVDKTAPTATFVSGEVQGNAYNSPLTPATYVFNITDPGAVGASGVGTYAGPGTVLVAQVREWNGLSSSASQTTQLGFENVVTSNIAAAARAGLGETFTATPNASINACVIGRFNAAQANASANALPVLIASGTQIGFCSPVPYTPGGVPTASTFPSSGNAPQVNGYFTTVIIATDQANNQSAPFKATILGDNSIPTVVNVDVPPTIAGNSTVALPANVTDNVGSGVGDFVASWPAVQYSGSAAGIYQYAITTGPGVAFDNVLTNSTPISPSLPNFIKNLQLNNGGVPTTTVANTTNATDFFVSAQDPSANVGFKDVVLSSQPTNFTGSATTWTNFTGGFTISASAAIVSNCAAAGCIGGAAPTKPTSTVITAVATGTTGIFTNPFVTTQLWYRPTGSAVWFLAPASDAVAAGPSTSDNGTNRTWNFAFTWNPPEATPATHLGGPVSLITASSFVDVVIVGINANGDAIAAGPAVPLSINLINP